MLILIIHTTFLTYVTQVHINDHQVLKYCVILYVHVHKASISYIFLNLRRMLCPCLQLQKMIKKILFDYFLKLSTQVSHFF